MNLPWERRRLAGETPALPGSWPRCEISKSGRLALSQGGRTAPLCPLTLALSPSAGERETAGRGGAAFSPSVSISAGILSPASPETNLADAVAKVFSTAHDFDFDAHKKNRQVAAVQLGKTHGVLLRREDEFGLAFLAAVDGFDDFLLRKPVMVGKAFGIDQFRAQFDQALLETLGLRDAAE